jgi:hypothetical protein
MCFFQNGHSKTAENGDASFNHQADHVHVQTSSSDKPSKQPKVEMVTKCFLMLKIIERIFDDKIVSVFAGNRNKHNCWSTA